MAQSFCLGVFYNLLSGTWQGCSDPVRDSQGFSRQACPSLWTKCPQEAGLSPIKGRSGSPVMLWAKGKGPFGDRADGGAQWLKGNWVDCWHTSGSWGLMSPVLPSSHHHTTWPHMRPRSLGSSAARMTHRCACQARLPRCPLPPSCFIYLASIP